MTAALESYDGSLLKYFQILFGDLKTDSLTRFFDKSVLTDSILVLNSNWNSRQSHHRLEIRHALWQKIKDLTPSRPDKDRSSIINLKERPGLSGYSISISHSIHLGGFLITPGKYSAGFDIEAAERISAAVVDRIALETEKSLFASTAGLWVAKESIFKGLGNLSLPPTIAPQTMNQLVVRRHEPITQNLWFFCSDEPSGAGLVWDFQSSKLALYLVPQHLPPAQSETPSKA